VTISLSIGSLSKRRLLAGSGLAVGGAVVLAEALSPLRSELGAGAGALVLAVAVVAGAAIGGTWAGLTAALACFVLYATWVGPSPGAHGLSHWQPWVVLGVYGALVAPVGAVVSALGRARNEARRREHNVRRLLELSELLVHEYAEPDLLDRVVGTVRDVFGMTSVVVLLPWGDELRPAASVGEPWTEDELAGLVPKAGVPVSVERTGGGMRALALAATGAPLGLIGVKGPALGDEDRELLRVFANHAAFSLERTRLREQALRTELLEETQRLQKALMGAVSHDLRTPLATIKVSASTLRLAEQAIDDEDRSELLRSIDAEADRLSRLVTNLLDMTRVEAGSLTVASQPVAVDDLVRESLAPLEPLLSGRELTVSVPEDLPLVRADHVLVGQVLANLLENAARHSPEGTPITISAAPAAAGLVEMAVADEGPGLGAEDEDDIFAAFYRAGPGQGTGVGLSIAKAFVEAHGQRIWAEDAPGGGARFCFTLPVLEERGAL